MLNISLDVSKRERQVNITIGTVACNDYLRAIGVLSPGHDLQMYAVYCEIFTLIINYRYSDWRPNVDFPSGKPAPSCLRHKAEPRLTTSGYQNKLQDLPELFQNSRLVFDRSTCTYALRLIRDRQVSPYKEGLNCHIRGLKYSIDKISRVDKCEYHCFTTYVGSPHYRLYLYTGRNRE